MSTHPYPVPIACVEPSAGARATQSLGQPPATAVAAHLAVCTACRIQRLAFADLDEHAVPPTAAVRGRIRALLDRDRVDHPQR